jgi:hypothetical protein
MTNTNRFNPGIFVVMIVALALMVSAAFAVQKEAEVKVKVLETPYVLEKPTGDTLIVESTYIGIVRGLAPAFGDGSYVTDPKNLRNSLANMVEATPREDLPSEDIRRFLSTQGGQAIRYRGLTLESAPASAARVRPFQARQTPEESRKAREECVHEFHILASTPGRVEELARALILVYNASLDKEKQGELAILEGHKKNLPALKSAVDKAQTSYDPLRSRLENLEEIRPETVSALETKKWLLAVDLAGAKTKKDAVQELMKESGELSQAAREQLEEIRITVHIELAGIVARQAKVDEILKISQDRAELLPKHDAAKRRLKGAQSEFDKCERLIKSYAQAVEDSIYYDHFKVENNTILVQPIQWQ